MGERGRSPYAEGQIGHRMPATSSGISLSGYSRLMALPENAKPRSGERGLALWWRQVIESCYHQGSDSGIGVCRGLTPAMGVFRVKLQALPIRSAGVASIAVIPGPPCLAWSWRLQLPWEARTAALGVRRKALRRTTRFTRFSAEGPVLFTFPRTIFTTTLPWTLKPYSSLFSIGSAATY